MSERPAAAGEWPRERTDWPEAVLRLDALRLVLRTQPLSVLRRAFDAGDFFGREVVEFIRELFYPNGVM